MFATAAFDLEDKIFVVYIAAIASFRFNVHLSCKAQIVSLKINVAFTAFLTEYTDFINISLLDQIAKLSKHTRINNYAIDPMDGKQSPYGPICSPDWGN